MASIKMCDFCGKVSNQMAAEVLIRPVDLHSDVFADGYEVRRTSRETQMDAFVKDSCHDCVKNFMQVRELKVLEANGEL